MLSVSLGGCSIDAESTGLMMRQGHVLVYDGCDRCLRGYRVAGCILSEAAAGWCYEVDRFDEVGQAYTHIS
jgi:hypothetical protein